LSRLLEAADLVGRPEAVRKQSKLLDDADDGVRYWAAVGLHAAGPQATTTRTALLKALKDKSAVVRIEAAATLVELDGNSDALAVLENELRSSRWDVVLHAARALELLGERARPALPAMREVYEAACKNMAAGSTVEFVRCCLNSALRGHGLQP
jgi:HEAT repeat protein